MTAQRQAISLHNREKADSGGIHNERWHEQTDKLQKWFLQRCSEEYWQDKIVFVLKDAARTEIQVNELLAEGFIV